jgi:hypothetical protein
MNDSQGLTDEDAALLRFAGKTYRFAGTKEQHIRDQFGISGTRYHQRINGLLDDPASVTHNDGEFAPTVNRLRRVREEKRTARSNK